MQALQANRVGAGRVGVVDMKNDLWSVIVLLLVAAIVFLAAFYFSRPATGEREYTLQGITIVSAAPPRNALADALQGERLTVWIAAANETETVACRQVALSEAVIGLASRGKNVTVQGRVADSYCISGDGKKTPCLAPSVTIANSAANRIHIANSSVTVEGSDAWLCKNAPVLRDLFSWALSK